MKKKLVLLILLLFLVNQSFAESCGGCTGSSDNSCSNLMQNVCSQVVGCTWEYQFPFGTCSGTYSCKRQDYMTCGSAGCTWENDNNDCTQLLGCLNNCSYNQGFCFLGSCAYSQTNCETGKSCSQGACNSILCNDTDHCYNGLLYDGYTCDGQGNCNVHAVLLEDLHKQCAASECTYYDYHAIFSFFKDADGEKPSGWSVSTPGSTSAKVITGEDGHRKVLKITDNDASTSAIVQKVITPSFSGSVELWMKTNKVEQNQQIRLYGLLNIITRLRFENNRFEYYDDSWKSVGRTASNNEWYRIRIDFETSYGNYKGLSKDQIRFVINGDSYGPFNIQNTGPVDTIYFITGAGGASSSVLYVDAIGYSWDEDYTAGDNLEGTCCGNNECEELETCDTCSADCGDCPPTCGDGECNGEETCDTCSADCGDCITEPVCGDGECDGQEDCETCIADCGECEETEDEVSTGTCYNERCGYSCTSSDECCEGETCQSTCEQGTCTCYTTECEAQPYCGDGSCNNNEDCETCLDDCGVCEVQPVCGDGACNGEEDCDSCSTDCGVCEVQPVCGDGECNGEETCDTCSADCGACPEEIPEECQINIDCDDDNPCTTETCSGTPKTCDYTTISGCAYENNCLPIGTRETINNSNSYCAINNKWTEQKTIGRTCQNNYECTTNFCSENACVDISGQLQETRGLLEFLTDILRSIASFFGIGEEETPRGIIN